MCCWPGVVAFSVLVHANDDQTAFTSKATALNLMDNIFSKLYRSQVWLSRQEARNIGEAGMEYARVYMSLTRQAYTAGRPLFLIASKIHALDHIFRDLLRQSDISEAALNPMIWGVQMDEDLIGRTCKISRRVSPRETVLRSFQRYMESAQAAWDREGMRRRV